MNRHFGRRVCARSERRGANLKDSESVKEVIAIQVNEQKWGKSRAWNVCKGYSLFLKMQGLTWQKPRYKPAEKIPFVPIEQEIDAMVAGSSKQLSTVIQVAKETGARRGEIVSLTWDDIDFVRKAVRITPEKGSNPRILAISDKSLEMLHNLPKSDQETIWIYKSGEHIGKAIRRTRKRIAHKLGNPRLLKFHIHAVRHWAITNEYFKTRDWGHVQLYAGHKSLKSTLRYVHLVGLPRETGYICKVARTEEEAIALIEAGFDHVTDMDSHKLFRKRKTSYLGAESFQGGPWSSLD